MLATTTLGKGSRLVLVHGFSQTSRCWDPVDTDLAADHEVVLVDAPGHGGSEAVRAGVDDGAALIGEVGDRATYVGYSMGGRYCLRLALERPELVTGLVLVGASPVIADPSARAARRRADEALAARLEEVGVATFIDEWLTQPLFASLPPGRRFEAERQANTTGGLASSLRLAGTGAQTSLWDRLDELAVPVLLVVGSRDAKFTTIARTMAEMIGPAATVVVVSDVGHAVPIEDPAAFVAALRRWERQMTADTSNPIASDPPNANCT